MAPNQPKTPSRNIRVSDELWHAAQEKAKAEGVTVTGYLVGCLEEWVGGSEADGARVEPAAGD